MISTTEVTWRAAVIGRWAARITGTLMVLFFLAFAIGEGFPEFTRLTVREKWMFAGLGLLLAGLILGWFREGWGGVVSIAGWSLMVIVERRMLWVWPFLIPVAIGLVHVLCWLRLRGPEPPSKPLHPRTRAFLILLGAALMAFVLLCANEMFNQPPLMTPAFRPSPEIVGAWRATVAGDIGVVFEVSPDGSVSGAVGDVSVVGGKIVLNRSWFGRLMHWRTDYLVRGSLLRAVEAAGGPADNRFTAPLFVRGSELEGSLFLFGPGEPKPRKLKLQKQ